jgi:hypothetical protein
LIVRCRRVFGSLGQRRRRRRRGSGCLAPRDQTTRIIGGLRCGWVGFAGLILIEGQVEGPAGVREKGSRVEVGHRDAKADGGAWAIGVGRRSSCRTFGSSMEIRSQRSLYTRRTHGVKRLQEVRKQRMPRATKSRSFEAPQRDPSRNRRRYRNASLLHGRGLEAHVIPSSYLARQHAGDKEVGILARAKLAVVETAQRQDSHDRQSDLTGSTAHGLLFG